MKKNEVQIGGVYSAKVNDRVVHVRIDAENRSGGWDATNLATNKKVRIKTVQRLREKISGPTGQLATPDEPEATTPAAPVQEAQVTSATPPKAKKGRKAKQADATPAEGNGKKMSCIDAAARVLTEAGEPLNAKQMIEAITTKGYWTSPGGKTPHATLYSAIIREISVKGADARFRKTERGKFAIQNA
jgi:hypothetical protein